MAVRSNRVSYHCNGTEKNLTECDHSGYLFHDVINHDCAGGISAGVICSSMLQNNYVCSYIKLNS